MDSTDLEPVMQGSLFAVSFLLLLTEKELLGAVVMSYLYKRAGF